MLIPTIVNQGKYMVFHNRKNLLGHIYKMILYFKILDQNTSADKTLIRKAIMKREQQCNTGLHLQNNKKNQNQEQK